MHIQFDDDEKAPDYVSEIKGLVDMGQYTEARNRLISLSIPYPNKVGIRRTIAAKTGIYL
ncbi:hypothetical protein PP16_gp36 [Pectobacterium phage PP16]|uniref:Uncharacterized protein n=1 Tax=Pectobacterium phage PP16 TaxID=1873958 RepID=A0A1B1PED7_9CAUD|nr:hypothetical protein PP16_gp36 [Pectobacterium phage PP16]ANT45335.1 hypothetical protein PP16_gp36 [Pectobacterium phage PP16]